MHNFVRNLITEWRKLDLPFLSDTIIVGTSGGADSTALVLALSELTKLGKLDLKIVVAHFNHRLRGKESDDDERYVRSLAINCGFAFSKAMGELKGKANLEERARNARYDFLHSVAVKQKARVVLTAHTQNDQAETLLLNLIRGSGSDGLCGMSSVRQLKEGAPAGPAIGLVRPLVTWAKRADTEQFCRDLRAEYRTDPMNDDRKFLRVRVRKDLMPLLTELNPNIVESLARTASLLRFVKNTEEPPATVDDISVADAKNLEKKALYRLLRGWLRQKRGNTRGLQLKHIEAIERLVFSPKSGRIAELPGGDSVLKSGGRLVFRQKKLEN